MNGKIIMNGKSSMMNEKENSQYITHNSPLKKGYKQTEVGVIPEDWEVKNYGDIFENIGGGAFRSKDGQKTGVKWLKIANVGINKIKWHEKSFLPISLIEEAQNFLLYENDYVLALTRPILNRKLKIAKLKKSDVPALLNQRVGKLISYNSDIDFIYYLLQSNTSINSLLESIAGTDPPNLGNKGLYAIICSLPPTKAEQTAIATALSDMDSLIEGLEKLLVKKRNIKQGAMQELLSPTAQIMNDELSIMNDKENLKFITHNSPLLKEGWVAKTLGEVLKVRHGKSQKGITDKNGQYPILASGGVIGRANKFLYDKPSVLIGRKGTIDVPQFMNSPFWTVDTLFYTEISEGYDAKFIFYMFNLIDWYSYNEASGVPSLNAKVIESIEKKFPKTINEQQFVTEILSDMDTEIEQLETQLSKYKMLKTGMMQELLTGKKRLI